jgi:hypothetical protein
MCHEMDLKVVARHFRCIDVAVFIADATFPKLDICPRVVISCPGQLDNIDGGIWAIHWRTSLLLPYTHTGGGVAVEKPRGF